MKKHRSKRRVRCVAAFVAVLSLCIWFTAQYRPLMIDSACKLAKNTALEMLNQTVCQLLEEQQTDFSQLMSVQTNENGMITSLQANSAKINRIKATAALAVKQSLSDISAQTIGVPLGTLCGFTMLSTFGPSISCRYLLSAIPTVGLEYHFDGAGINQTLHSILMVIKVPLSVTLPLQSRDVEIQSSFIIGETILVGDVPDAYTNVISDPEVADDLFNYGDVE